MRIPGLILLAALLGAGARAEVTWTIHAAVLEGDPVDDVGLVTRIDGLAINSAGQWLVEADTDHLDGDADTVILRGGGLAYREGQALPAPSGAAIDSFDALTLNSAGHSGWNLFLDGPGVGFDSGLFRNTRLVVQEGDFSTAPQFAAGTRYLGFFDAKINDAGDMLSVASVDDPNIPSGVDRALVVYQLDPNGALLSETVLVKEGDIPAGQTADVTELGTESTQSAFNNAGDVLYFVELNAPATSDGAIYINGELIALEGAEVPGDPERVYEFLAGRGLDLNDRGDFVFKADLSDTQNDDVVLIRNDEVFRREGQSLAAIAPFVFAGTSPFGLSSGPVQIDPCGSVLYFGDWDDPDTDVDTGLFLDDRLLVQEGVSTFNGSAFDVLDSGADAFRLSDNGRFAIFEATLADGTNGAFVIEFARCPDLDASGAVDLSDLAALLSAFGSSSGEDAFDCGLDLDFSGSIDLPDLAGILSLFGGPCE